MSSKNIKVAVVPLDIKLADPQANINAVMSYIAEIPDATDIIVLPELFSTGYISDPIQAAQMAETNHDDTIRAIKNIASTYNVALCGSFLARTGATLFNRAFFIEPDGETTFYDKRHLFCISEEAKVAAHGTVLPPVIRYRGWSITMAICYDVRFPVWIRKSAMLSDLLIIPANWPQKRAFAWKHLLQARAIENQAFVVGCNRSGSDDWGCYDNESYIIDYMGKVVNADTIAGNVLVASISKADLERFRQHFPVWRDADTFSIDL